MSFCCSQGVILLQFWKDGYNPEVPVALKRYFFVPQYRDIRQVSCLWLWWESDKTYYRGCIDCFHHNSRKSKLTDCSQP